MRVGYKKVYATKHYGEDAIVKLEIIGIVRGNKKISPDGKRRTSKAKVLWIKRTKQSWPRPGQLGKRRVAIGVSRHDSSFEYKKGKIVTPHCQFEKSKNIVCGSGIHFFWKLRDALDY